MNLFAPPVKKTLSLILSLHIFCPAGWAQWSQQSAANSQNSPRTVTFNSEEFRDDPFIDSIKNFKEPEGAAQSFKDFPRNSPLVDQDPFFLRAQRWVSTNEKNSTSNLRIELPELEGRALEINAPLHLIYRAGNFLFFAANEGSTIFQEKSDGLDEVSEGIFVAQIDELTSVAPFGGHVPLFYIPMPKGNWTGNVIGLESLGPDNVMLVDANGESLPLSLADTQVAVQVGRLNFLLSAGRAAQNMRRDKIAPRKDQQIFPSIGSTANFGIIFTGFDFGNSNNDAFAQVTSKAWTHKMLAKFGLPLAHATDTDEEAAQRHEMLMERMWRVGTVLGLAYIAAIVLKHTVFRNYMKLRQAEEQKNEKEISRFRRWFRDVGDVYAHNLTALYQFPAVWAATNVAFIADRFAPKLAASDNGAVRKLLENYYFFMGKSYDRTPINGKVWVAGSVVLGGIDTVCVYIQYMYTNEEVAHLIADVFPSQRQYVLEAWDPSNAESRDLLSNELMRNMAGWLVAGAASLSGDQQTQFDLVMKGELSNRMRQTGKDPFDPKNADELDKMRESLRKEMKLKLGLPGNEAFIYDANTLYGNTLKLFAYNVPQNVAADDAEARRFWGRTRPGLLLPSLKTAHKKAQQLAEKYPQDPAMQSALLALAEALKDANLLQTYLSDTLKTITRGAQTLARNILFKTSEPIVDAPAEKHFENSRRLRKLRQELMVLTFEKAKGNLAEQLPASWIAKHGSSGAALAGKLFRAAMLEFMDHKKPVLNGPETKKLTLEMLQESEQKSITELALEFPNTEPTLAAFKSEHPAEFELKFNEMAATLSREAWLKDNSNDKDINRGPLSQGQYWLARRKANRAIKDYRLSNGGASFDGNVTELSQEESKLWQQNYALRLVHGFGLKMDFRDTPISAENLMTLAYSSTERDLDDLQMRTLHDSFSSQKQIEFKASLLATNIVRNYSRITLESPDVSALSPSQPGFFASWRQSSLLQSPKDEGEARTTLQKAKRKVALTALNSVTRTLRALESPFSLRSYGPGLLPLIERNVPFAYDIKNCYKSIFKRLAVNMTAIYWWNYFVFDYGLKPTQWVWAAFCSILIAVPVQTVFRLSGLQGWQPTKNMKTMVLFAFIWSWATFGANIPQMMYQKSFNQLAGPVINPVVDTVKTVVAAPMRAIKGIAGNCADLFGGGPK